MIVRILIVTVFLIASGSARGQAVVSTDVQVKLSLAEKKTVYRIGEPIKLVLEFATDRATSALRRFPAKSDSVRTWLSSIGRDKSLPEVEALLVEQIRESAALPPDRVAEANAQCQGQIERELIDALINGKSWKLPPERVQVLKLSCLTEMCKQSFRIQ